MPIYEYRCKCSKEFEELKLMSQCLEPSSCPECGKEADRTMSSTHYRIAEPFSVMDSEGNITQKRQVLNDMPDWRENKPSQPSPGVTVPFLARDGKVYLPRGMRKT